MDGQFRMGPENALESCSWLPVKIAPPHCLVLEYIIETSSLVLDRPKGFGFPVEHFTV